MTVRVVIVGTGRCGSSALAGMVSKLGVAFPKDLVPGHPVFAPTGHFESFQWKAVGMRVERKGFLSTGDFNTYKRLITKYNKTLGNVWGIKDPYLSWTLTDVLPLFGEPEEIRLIVIHRSFTEVVASRQPHSKLTKDQATAHQIKQSSFLFDHLERISSGQTPYLVEHVGYEQLLHDPLKVAKLLTRFIFQGMVTRFPQEETIKNAAKVIKPEVSKWRLKKQ